MGSGTMAKDYISRRNMLSNSFEDDIAGKQWSYEKISTKKQIRGTKSPSACRQIERLPDAGGNKIESTYVYTVVSRKNTIAKILPRFTAF